VSSSVEEKLSSNYEREVFYEVTRDSTKCPGILDFLLLQHKYLCAKYHISLAIFTRKIALDSIGIFSSYSDPITI